ncbi:MAG TPA: hypothetical protein VEI01_19665 [Terriglobales bacterium]|nr:hypothetical protein [Terriglobales bacterium]
MASIAVLDKIATGTFPIQGGTAALIFHAILELTPRLDMRLNPNVPLELERIMNRRSFLVARPGIGAGN